VFDTRFAFFFPLSSLIFSPPLSARKRWRKRRSGEGTGMEENSSKHFLFEDNEKSFGSGERERFLGQQQQRY
jgi:hypothetical protein